MRVFRRNSLLVFLAFASGVALAQTGLIRGTLLDSDGDPIAKANVFAMFDLHCDLSGKATKAKIEFGEQDACLSVLDGRVDATTDEAGVFELQGLQWSVYELLAQKPEDGYCATFQEPMKVVISPVSPYAQVTFHLPPKCALLKGTVKNAKTGELLSGVTLRIRPTKDDGQCDIFGAFVPINVLIPSHREFTLEVLAEGFKTWVYRDGFDKDDPTSDAPATPLNLQAGERLDLEITLTPRTRGSAGIDCPIDWPRSRK